MSSQGFYPALSPDKDTHSIRILELDPLPAGLDQVEQEQPIPLTGTIRVVSLADRPVYTALSYVWGDFDQNQKYTICCGDSTIEITRNCSDALHALRRQFGKMGIWVDSICIDQSNKTERNHQVQMMGEVYSHAKMVYVWLNFTRYTSHEDRGAFKPLRRLAEDDSKSSKRWYGIQCVDTVNMYQIFKHEWFIRGWTLQEAALAQNLTFVAVDDRISLNEILPAIEHLRKVQNYHPGQNDLFHLTELRKMFTANGHPHLVPFDTGPIIQQMRRRRVSQNHDLAYAYYGLLKKAGAPLTEVDYTKRAGQILCDFFRDLVRWDRSFLALLEDAGTATPTWLPFQSGQQSSPQAGAEAISIATQDGHKCLGRREDMRRDTFTIRGHKLAVVAWSIPAKGPTGPGQINGSECVAALRNCVFHFSRLHKSSVELSIDQIKKCLYEFVFSQRTWIGDQYFLPQSISLLLEHVFACSCEDKHKASYTCNMSCFTKEDIGSEILDWDQYHTSCRLLAAILPVLEARTLLITNDGGVGIGPALVEVGHEVCQIAGVPTPIILSKEPSGAYKLIGPISLRYNKTKVQTLDEATLERIDLV